MAGNLTQPAKHSLTADPLRLQALDLWGIDAIVPELSNTDAVRVVLDRLPAGAQQVAGWTAQAGTTSENTRDIVSGDDGYTLDCGDLGVFRIADIEHDGHGWSVLQLAEP